MPRLYMCKAMVHSLPFLTFCTLRGCSRAGAGFPSCSHALSIADATPLMAWLRQLLRIVRVRSKNARKYASSYSVREPTASRSATSAGSACGSSLWQSAEST